MPDPVDPFDTNTKPTEETPPVSSTNPFEDHLKEIVNDEGQPKYKSVEDALTGLSHSQAHIKKLEGEAAERNRMLETLQAELDKRASVEEALERLSKPSNPEPQSNQTQTPALDESKIQALIAQTLEQTQQQTVKQENFGKVSKMLTETYGDKASAVVAKRAAELNTTPAALKTMSEQSPEMVMVLLGGVSLEKTEPSTSSISPTSNTVNDNPMPKFERSLVRGGATDREMGEAWRELTKYTHKRLGVQS